MPDDPNDHKPDHEFDGVTRLFIRTNPADDGSVPLAAGLQFWTSPDILIVKPGGAVGGEAVAMQPNQVRVTVWNGGGIPAVDAYVDAFVADPSTVITPATARLIGGDYVTVQGYNSHTLDLPWTPEAADAGHRCLIARVSLIAPPDTYTNPAIFDVVGDRHVAQRNIQVVSVAAGKSAAFRFLIRPVGRKGAAAVTLMAKERTLEVQPEVLAQMSGCGGGLRAPKPLAGLGVRVLSGDEVRPGRTRLDPGSFKGSVTAKLADGSGAQPAAVSFAVAPDEEPGRLHLVDVVQMDQRSRRPQGGLTFVVKVS